MQAVLNTPLSAEVKQPTCRLPRNASTLDRLDWTYKYESSLMLSLRTIKLENLPERWKFRPRYKFCDPECSLNG